MNTTIGQKREILKMCHEVIPAMNEEELKRIGVALSIVVTRLIEEGLVK